MSVPAIEVFRALPDAARAFAQPLQGFFAEVWSGLYIGELGADMRILANPDDMTPGGAVARQEERIAVSTDLHAQGTSAYIIARDPNAARHTGIVGAGKFTRLAPDVVQFEEVDTALDRRGERIGPKMPCGSLPYGRATLLCSPHYARTNARSVSGADWDFYLPAGGHITRKFFRILNSIT